MDTGWEVYSKMVLKQLEDLSNSMNGLRQEIQELKSEIAEIRGQQGNVQDLKEWKNKIDENEKSWVGFCQYRKFWAKENSTGEIENLDKLNQILLDGHGSTLTVDNVLDLNPRAVDSAGNIISSVEMIWTINGQISTGTLEESNYIFSTEEIGLYEIQVSADGGSASITCDFIHGDAVRIVVTAVSYTHLTLLTKRIV